MGITKLAAICLPITVSFLSSEMRTSIASTTPYSHGMMNCLKENEGPGLRLVLTQAKTCKGRESYPRLEIDIREQPILAHKAIIIGPDNGAFRCLSENESCEQALSGKVTFDHFPQDAAVNETDGSYDLQFRGGPERGRFAIECPGNC